MVGVSGALNTLSAPSAKQDQGKVIEFSAVQTAKKVSCVVCPSPDLCAFFEAHQSCHLTPSYNLRNFGHFVPRGSPRKILCSK